MSVCTPIPKFPSLHAELVICLQRAYENMGLPTALDSLSRALFVIKTLALSTSEFALLHNRLCNARRYSMQEEWGAARFELRLLLHSMGTL